MSRGVDITVIVPAYQTEPFLEATLASVARQSRGPFELIVVDDGSTDGTCAVVESFANTNPKLSVRLLREPHRGPGAARNAGVRAAISEWIAFLDSDDLWHQEKLERMLIAIEANPQANFFCHNETMRALNGVERVTDYSVKFSCDKPVSRQLYKNNCFSTSAVVCRRDLVLKWNGFDETLTSAQDYELWLKMSPDLVPVFVPEVLGTYVLRKGNIANTRFWKRLFNILRVKHKYRSKGGMFLYAYSIPRVTISHMFSPFREIIRRLLTRGG